LTAITEADRAPHSPFDVQPDLRIVPLRTPTLPPATHTNCVIIGRRDVVAVDPASPYEDEQRRLRDWLEVNGLRLRAILLTHQHPDHVGGVNALREALDVPVLAHPATTAALQGQVRVDEALFEGDLVSDAVDADLDVPLRVLHTPGHARGHLAFRDERTGALVAGDLVAGQGTIVIDPPDGDMADYLATLGRLVVLGTGVIVPAHGGAIEKGEDKLLEYIGHRQMREEQLQEALHARPERCGRPLDLVPTIYPDVPPMFHPLAARQVLAHLMKLEQEGSVDRPDGSTGAPGQPVYMNASMAGWTTELPVFRLLA